MTCFDQTWPPTPHISTTCDLPPSPRNWAPAPAIRVKSASTKPGVTWRKPKCHFSREAFMMLNMFLRMLVAPLNTTDWIWGGGGGGLDNHRAVIGLLPDFTLANRIQITQSMACGREPSYYWLLLQGIANMEPSRIFATRRSQSKTRNDLQHGGAVNTTGHARCSRTNSVKASWSHFHFPSKFAGHVCSFIRNMFSPTVVWHSRASRSSNVCSQAVTITTFGNVAN